MKQVRNVIEVTVALICWLLSLATVCFTLLKDQAQVQEDDDVAVWLLHNNDDDDDDDTGPRL